MLLVLVLFATPTCQSLFCNSFPTFDTIVGFFQGDQTAQGSLRWLHQGLRGRYTDGLSTQSSYPTYRVLTDHPEAERGQGLLWNLEIYLIVKIFSGDCCDVGYYVLKF